MRGKHYAAWLAGLIITCAPAAAAVDLFGYGEIDNLLQTGDETQLLTVSKLRVDLLSDPGSGFSCGANLNFHLYHGSTSWNPLDYIPTAVTTAISPEVYELYIQTYRDKWKLDNIWLKLRSGRFDLTIGKQQLAFGSGYAWNPTDLFNTINLLDVTYENPGWQSVRLDADADRLGSFTLLGAPAAAMSDATALLQWQRNFPRLDVALLVAHRPWHHTEYYSDGTPPAATQVKRYLYGGSLVGQLFGLGIWAEYAWHDLRRVEFGDFSELVVGSDYTWRNGVYLLMEYLWNGDGRSGSEEYTLTDWMRLFSGETRSLATSQLYCYSSYPVSDLVSAGVTLLYSVSDGAAGLIPTLYYSPEAETEITLMAHFYGGDDRDQYNTELGAGGLLRFRRYF